MIFGGKQHSASHHIGSGDASSARATIRMAPGELNLHGGAQVLMEGDFTFSEGMEPWIDYRVEDGRGALEIAQPSTKDLRVTRNHWDIRLNDRIPFDLVVDHAAGESEIDASSLTLASFELDQSAGQSKVALGGDQPDLAWVDIDMAAGKLELGLTGRYPKLRDLRIDASAGKMTLDLSGRWESDLDARIDSSAGQITVRLPKDVAVVAEVDSALAQVRARGLTREHGRYRSGPPGAAVTLRLRIDVSVAQVTLEVVE